MGRVRSYNDLLSEIPKSRWQSDKDAKHCSLIECGAVLGDGRHNCRRCGRVICNDCGRFRMLLRDPSKTDVFVPRRVCGFCVRLAEGEVPDESITVLQPGDRDAEDSESDYDAFNAARENLPSKDADAIGRLRAAARPSAAELPIRKSFDSSTVARGCISEEEDAAAPAPRKGRRGSNEARRPDDPAPEAGPRLHRAPAPAKKIHKSTSLASLRTFFSRSSSNAAAAASDDEAAVDVRYNGGLCIRCDAGPARQSSRAGPAAPESEHGP